MLSDDGERTGTNRFDAFRAGDDGCGRDDSSAHDRLGDDNASLHRLQEDPKEW